MLAVAPAAPPSITVNMGEIALLTSGQVGNAILGSCLGIAVYEPTKRVGALAHVVLPTSEGRSGSPGKFVDSAIPWMLDNLRPYGVNPGKLICKLAGGANMFAGNGPFQIGQQNIQVARRELEKFRVRVVAEHLEGNKGRRISFDLLTGHLTIESAGRESTTI